MTSRKTKIQNYLDWRVRVVLTDGRYFVGKFKSSDRFYNLILVEAEEVRTVKAKKGVEEQEEKRFLGIILLRGECIVTMIPEQPPPKNKETAAQKPVVPTTAIPIARGMPAPIAGGGALPVMTAPWAGNQMVPQPMMQMGRGMPMPGQFPMMTNQWGTNPMIPAPFPLAQPRH
ncbi:putative Small nuclear ribonucleoprotein-associated protein B' [Blattamonas nauphoetae]|uniref:Sm protein B n=1 Tax=Blattamonas nauphoetae TaxID=2049346 RepID=A0ABQ9XWN9_9EUKA|nr:putative Small nuclear ribonucleoprotein-associated protein B' [Blattamonas nauphoetae]